MQPFRLDPAPSQPPSEPRLPRQEDEDAALLATLHDWLEPGERVEAVARPSLSQIATWSLTSWVIFAPWTLFCLDWFSGMGTDTTASLGSGMADHAWQWFRLAALPFLAIGLAGLSLPAWMIWRANATRHVITDRRELTLEASLPTRVVRRHRARVPSSRDDSGFHQLDFGGWLRPALRVGQQAALAVGTTALVTARTCVRLAARFAARVQRTFTRRSEPAAR